MPKANNTARNPSRNWVFTLNNPLDELDFTRLSAEVGVRYAVWQRERAPQTGTEHFQGYVELSRPCRYTALHPAGLTGAHFEVRQGTRDQARDYCRKADTRIAGPYEFGRWSSVGQGKRTDLDVACEMVKSGSTLKQIAQDHPTTFVRYSKGLLELKTTLNSGRDEAVQPTVVLYYGPPGCGKSSTARARARQDGTVYTKPPGKWWPDYNNETWVIEDDFSGTHSTYTDWKLIHDRYEHKVETKHGHHSLTSTKFAMTSTKLPREWWDVKVVHDFEEISRRITEVNWWPKKGDPMQTFLSDQPSNNNDARNALDKLSEALTNFIQDIVD